MCVGQKEICSPPLSPASPRSALTVVGSGGWWVGGGQDPPPEPRAKMCVLSICLLASLWPDGAVCFMGSMFPPCLGAFKNCFFFFFSGAARPQLWCVSIMGYFMIRSLNFLCYLNTWSLFLFVKIDKHIEKYVQVCSCVQNLTMNIARLKTFPE